MKTKINFVITGVWFRHNKKGFEHISHVMLHKNLGDEILCPGEKKTVEYIINLLRTKTIYTCKWAYEDGEWSVGSEVRSIKLRGKTYIATDDWDISNNIENVLNMACLTEPCPVPVISREKIRITAPDEF
jgi:hypothetical protein